MQNLEPKAIWKYFEQLCQIPRASGNEEKVVDWICEFGKEHGLEVIREECGNVVLRKGATPGMEGHKGVILQGHVDMVPQNDEPHDWASDPIQAYVDGDWVRAKGTTLGADNGIGVAMALAVLASKDIAHGPIEAFFTVNEETGLKGAQAHKGGILQGDILINLDSEEDGELCVGCAGSVDVMAVADVPTQAVPEDFYYCEIHVEGLRGGHSGTDIVLEGANSNKVAARLTHALLEKGAQLIDFQGGTLRNAIAREAVVSLALKDVEAAEEAFGELAEKIMNEYSATDPEMELSLEVAQESVGALKASLEQEELCALCPEEAIRLMKGLLACPNGVARMSAEVPGLVETSNNLSKVEIFGGHFEAHSMMRSSVDSAKEALVEQFCAAFSLAGCRIEVTNKGYSGWAPNAASPILKTMVEVYEKLYGSRPHVNAIHAGLECGIISGFYPHLDMISVGPTILNTHTPHERDLIPTVAN